MANDNALVAPPNFAPPESGLNGVGNALGYYPQRNMTAATAGMKLSPEEQALYRFHLDNLAKGGVPNNGGTSTLYQVGFQHDDGRTYNVPSVYDGQILSPDDAIARAKQIGLQNFPSYLSDFKAENRYQQMHGYMERDTENAMAGTR